VETTTTAEQDVPAGLRAQAEPPLPAQPLGTAVKVPGFQKLVENHRVVAVLPAAPGWTVQSAQFGPFAPFTTPIGAWVMDGEGMFWPVIGVSEPEDGGPYRPSPDGEWALRPHLSSGNKIVPPKD
jgi:hypothetical protein